MKAKTETTEEKAKPARKVPKKAVEEVKEDKTKKAVKRPAKKAEAEAVVLPFTVEEGIQKMNADEYFLYF